MIDLKTGDGNGQSILMIVLLGLIIIVLILLIGAAYFIIPAAVKNSGNKDSDNKTREPAVAVNIINSEKEKPESEASTNAQSEKTNTLKNDEIYYQLDNSYILPFSNRRNLIPTDIKNLSLEELTLARNEIYARHGYVFKTPWIRQYFESKSWYVPNPYYQGDLNDTEYYNVQLIKEYEDILKSR